MASSSTRLFFSAALELVVILSRHGVRSPLQTNDILEKYSTEAWPQWPVGKGIMTEHGAKQVAAMGNYYRERYVHEGLLSGDAQRDAAVVLFRSDSDQRTIESARQIGHGLLPGQPIAVASRPASEGDPLFNPVKMHLGAPNEDYAQAAILGRMGNQPRAVVEAHRKAYDDLQRVLAGPNGLTAGKEAILATQSGFGPHEVYDLVAMTGPLRLGIQFTDAFLLEYTQGMPADQVGWGRVGPKELQEFLSLHSLYFNLTQKTLYSAQVNGSNLALHLIETLDQAASGRPVAGALGHPGQKIVVLAGHDTNIINFAGLLDLDWQLPGTAADPVLPGGAMVFELRRAEDGTQRLRIYYTAQSLEDIRKGEPATLAHPPAVAPVFIPNCSAATEGYDAPLGAVEERLRAVIVPKFTTAE